MDDRLRKIKKQVEFYFSDSNLPRDNFLRAKVANDKDGYVDVSILLGFNRLKSLEAKEEDFVTIWGVGVEEEKKNDENEKEVKVKEVEVRFLGLSEDNKRIRRMTPLPTVSNFNDRSLYVKGFEVTTSQEFLEGFFEKESGQKILCVRRRLDRMQKGRPFKGSVFVEFKSVKDMEEFLKRKDEIKFDDKPLLMMKKKAYVAMKKKEIGERKRKREVAFFDEKLKEISEAYKDCIVKITKIPTDKNLGFAEIKSALKLAVGVDKLWVEYPYKDVDKSSAVVRFDDSEGRQNVLEKSKTEEGIVLGGAKVEVTILEGEEKEVFLKTLARALLKDDNEPPHKKRKLD